MRRRVAVLVLAGALVASRAQAFIPLPDFDDPFVIAKLEALRTLIIAIHDKVLSRQEQISRAIEDRLTNVMFPLHLQRALRTVKGQVSGIRDEVGLLCQWRLSQRTLDLKAGLLAPVRICKLHIDEMFGGFDHMWNRDQMDMSGRIAASTANLISDRVEQEKTTWTYLSKSLSVNVAMNYRTVGEANRHEAAALAFGAGIAKNNDDLVTQLLLLENDEDNVEAFERQQGRVLLFSMISSLAGEKEDR